MTLHSGAFQPSQPFSSSKVIDCELLGSTSALARPVTLRSPATSRKLAGLGGKSSPGWGLPQVQVQDVSGVEDCSTLEDILPVAEEGGEGETGGGLDHLDTSELINFHQIIQNCTGKGYNNTAFQQFHLGISDSPQHFP